MENNEPEHNFDWDDLGVGLLLLVALAAIVWAMIGARS